VIRRQLWEEKGKKKRKNIVYFGPSEKELGHEGGERSVLDPRTCTSFAPLVGRREEKKKDRRAGCKGQASARDQRELLYSFRKGGIPLLPEEGGGKEKRKEGPTARE